jgi:hypothetical protein
LREQFDGLVLRVEQSSRPQLFGFTGIAHHRMLAAWRCGQRTSKFTIA